MTKIPIKYKNLFITGGEQQRVALARILLRASELILAN